MDDTTLYKPIVRRSNGQVKQFAYWPGGGGAGSGTVTDFIFTDGNGFDGTVTNSTTTPTLSLNIQLGFQDWYTHYLDVSGNAHMNYFIGTSGTGAANSIPTTAIADGWVSGRTMSTGTTTSGRAFIYFGGSGGYAPIAINSSFRYNSGFKVRLEDLSDGTETYECYGGFTDEANTIASVTDGVLFHYSHGSSSGQWECITRSNGTTTTTASGVTVVADTDYNLEVSVYNTEANFYINGTLVATNTTNIPSGIARQTSQTVTIRKLAGTTSRTAYVEWLGYGKRNN